MNEVQNLPPLRFHPLTPARWDDFTRLFGARGACGGCWCMHWRLTSAEYEEQKGAGNREAMRALVARGELPGLLAYVDGEPVGWIAVSPRESFPRLRRSRILAPVDGEPVWSVVCFFVAKEFRNRGLSVQLLEAAATHVAEQGGHIVEGYPVEPRQTPQPPVFVFHGLASAFTRAGFSECARRSPTRPIMRRHLV
jgi:GNAT superfamily N-acetyltransferase